MLLTRSHRRRAASPPAALARKLRPVHVALGRAGLGGAMLLRPTDLPRLLGVDSAASTRTAWVVQMLGAREVALGAGAVWALRDPDSRVARSWVLAGALSDGLDAVVVGSALARGRVGRPTGALAVGVAVLAVAVGLAGERPR